MNIMEMRGLYACMRGMEVNEKWDKMYGDELSTEKTSNVQFEQQPKVRLLIHCGFSHRAARIGPWMQLTLDRIRFRRRITIVEETIKHIFNPHHRAAVYHALHQDK